MDEPTVTIAEVEATDIEGGAAVEPQAEDVLVEEVSIDGMCGVY